MEIQSVSGKPMSHSSDSLYAYSLVACTPGKIAEAVAAERNLFAERYATPSLTGTPSCIPIAGFSAREEMESTLFRWMHRIISAQKKFMVSLEKFNGFAPHTIYLQVRDHQPFQQLAREMQVVDQYIRSYGCPSVQPVIRPHLTIAGALPETVYRQAEPVYAQKTFQASFEVKELVLLRRQDAFDKDRQISVFGLQP